MRAFRDPDMEEFIEAMGFEAFFDKSFSKHVDLALHLPRGAADLHRPMEPARRADRHAQLVPGVASRRPAARHTVDMPDWVLRAFPKIKIPVRVIWGLEDKALLPIQLEGIGEVGDDVEVFPLKGVGHFAPWEAPDQVAAALTPFLARGMSRYRPRPS